MQEIDNKTRLLARRYARLLLATLIFVLIFFYPWQGQKSPHSPGYIWTPDSPSYIWAGGWLDPWRSFRSIGYPAFLHPFLYPDHQKFATALSDAYRAGIDVGGIGGPKTPAYTIAKEVGVAGTLAMVAFVQKVLLALSIAIFYLALCCWFPSIFSFLILGGIMWLSPPPDPSYIMTEPLSCALTWLCGAFLLYAPKSGWQASLFALSCLCAALAFLVRPQTLALTGLCSLIFLYEVFLQAKHQRIRAIFKQALAFSPLLLTYGYIGWLSITGGQLFLHTLYPVYYSSFCYYAEAEDAQYMPTERSRKFTAWFGEHKKEFVDKIKKREGRYSNIYFLTKHDSPVRERGVIGDALIHSAGLPEAFKHFENEKDIAHLGLLEHNIFGKELASSVRHRHMRAMLVNHWHNLIGGLGYYRDVWHLARLPRASFAINLMCLTLCACAFVACANIRWPLVILVGIHLMSLLVAALGHFVLSRYVEPTEPLLLLAGFCALWGLGLRAYGVWKERGQDVAAA